MKTFYEKDADTNLIKKKKVAIFGQVIQDQAHTLNLKDAGFEEVFVALGKGYTSIKKSEREDLKFI